MNPAKIIPAPKDPKAGQCSECGKHTCNCDQCQNRKGGRVNICNKCAARIPVK